MYVAHIRVVILEQIIVHTLADIGTVLEVLIHMTSCAAIVYEKGQTLCHFDCVFGLGSALSSLVFYSVAAGDERSSVLHVFRSADVSLYRALMANKNNETK